MSALDRLDLSKQAAAVGLDQATAKAFLAAGVWQLFHANADHVIFSWAFIHLTWGSLRPALAALIGPEPGSGTAAGLAPPSL